MAINYDPTALSQVKTYDAQMNLFIKTYPHFMEAIELSYYTAKDPQAGVVFNTSLPNLNFVHHLLSKMAHSSSGTAITNWKLTGTDLTTLQAAFYPHAEFCIVTDTTSATTKNTSQKEALKGTILSTLQTLYAQPYDDAGTTKYKSLLDTNAADEKFKQESKAFIAITQTTQVDGMDIDKAHDFCMMNKANFSGLETSETPLPILCQYLLKGSPQNQMLFDTSFLKLQTGSATEEYGFVPGTFDFDYDGVCETCICS